MALYLLDTNHLSPVVTSGHPLNKRILEAVRAGHHFAIPVPVLTEMLFGISLLPRAKHNLQTWEEAKTRFDYYGLERPDAERAAELQLALRRRGIQLATVDALIAAVALRHDATLLTTDKDFSAVPALKRQNWL